MIYIRIFRTSVCLLAALLLAAAVYAQAQDRGVLQITYVAPAAVNVSIIGPAGFAQQAQITGGQVFADLAPGSYTVDFRKPGFANVSKTVEVKAGETTTLDAKLEKWQVSEDATGALQVVWVQPANVNLEVLGPMGYEQQKTVTGGQAFAGLSQGRYHVTASKPGFYTQAKVATVDAQQTASLSFVLKAIPGYKPPAKAAAPAAGSSAQESATVSDEDLLAQGKSLYVQAGCSGCHGGEGGGNQGPAFAGNAKLANPAFVAGRVLHGRGGMPSFGARFSDVEIAAVSSYIRSSWGNGFGTLSPQEVAAAR